MTLALRQSTEKKGNVVSIHRKRLADRPALQKLSREAGARNCRRTAVSFVGTSPDRRAVDDEPEERVRPPSRITCLSKVGGILKGTRIARVQRVIEYCDTEHFR